MSLSRFVVLIKSNYNNKYLRYIEEDVQDVQVHEFLQFSEEEVVSPYVKFEVEMAKSENGLVHIRCCYNNKYWVRWTQNHWWIVAGADETEEDQSKWSCTLFKPIYIDSDAKTIRFLHVQLGHYACLWRTDAPFASCLYAGSENLDQDLCDVCTIIDRESLLIMPKHVAFKGNISLPRFLVLKSNYNNKYLRYIHEDLQVHGFLQFSEEEVVSPYVKFEVEMAKSENGLVHIRCCYNNKYWVRWTQNHWWIVAGADEPEEDQSKWSCTLFKPIYIDSDAKTIRFLHVQLGHYACLWRTDAPFASCLYAGSENLDQDLCDVCTIIDRESLLIMPKHVAFKGNISLPRFLVLKSNYNNKYLRYIQEDGHVQGFLRFSGEEVVNPYAKFKVEMARSGNGLVHIRCCYNNKYWVRWTQNHWWIVAGADVPEEDQSKWSCTLFKPIYIDSDAKTIRFLHVQLGHYACLWRTDAPFASCLYAGSENLDQDLCDVCTIIDRESLLIMPKHVAFKGNISLPRFLVLKSNYNNKYLRYIHEDLQVHGFLQFSEEEVVSPYVKFEVEMAKSENGLVHIRCCYNNKYWVRWTQNHWWIVAGADEPEEDQSKWSCTLFKPIYIDSDAKTIRFLHVQLGHYACLWRTDAPFASCLYAGSENLDQDLCDVCIIIDRESLLIMPKHVAFKGNISLPRFLVLKSNYNNKYLRYIQEDGHVQGFLRFSGEEVVNPYAKFKVEMARSGNGLVHIRCCYNNKYWVRWTQNHWWIVAGADVPEEDQSKWSCTLFKPICVDTDAKIVRFLHVQLGYYACLWRIASPFASCLFARSENPNKDSCDVCTIIDWESLLVMPKHVAFKGNISLPRFLVLKSNYNNKYLRYIHEDLQVHGFLQFSGEEVVSPYAKFEVEMAKNENGLVHIRCCYNNKYWVRWTQNHWWIVAGADEPEEDQSKWSCTLFKPVYVDADAKTIRFLHVQLGNYACLWRIAAPFASCLFAGSENPDKDSCDVCTIIDWESLLIMPKYVGFKGDNGQYLSARWIEGHQYLQFASNDVGDPTVGNEIFTTPDGSIRVKSDYFGKFWRRSPNWIWADSDALIQEMDFTSPKNVTISKKEIKNKSGGILRDVFKGRCCQTLLCRSHSRPPETDVKTVFCSSDDTNNINFDTLFWPIKVDHNVVALRNLGNNNFCKRLTTEGKKSCLNAGVPTISKEARIEVEELVISRQIYNVNFRLLDARIYNQRVLTMATEVAINRTQEPNNAEVKLSYTETKSSTWKASVSLKLGVKTTFQTGIPFIARGKIEISAKFSGAYEWGETKTSSTVLETVYKVIVPPMTKVTVSLLATTGSCDVPFSYTQRDTLTNGQQVTYNMDDGIYTGISSFNFKYETKQETL